MRVRVATTHRVHTRCPLYMGLADGTVTMVHIKILTASFLHLPYYIGRVSDRLIRVESAIIVKRMGWYDLGVFSFPFIKKNSKFRSYHFV